MASKVCTVCTRFGCSRSIWLVFVVSLFSNAITHNSDIPMGNWRARNPAIHVIVFGSALFKMHLLLKYLLSSRFPAIWNNSKSESVAFTFFQINWIHSGFYVATNPAHLLLIIEIAHEKPSSIQISKRSNNAFGIWLFAVLVCRAIWCKRCDFYLHINRAHQIQCFVKHRTTITIKWQNISRVYRWLVNSTMNPDSLESYHSNEICESEFLLPQHR